MVGHAKLVPGMRIHGLERGGLVQRRGRFFVLPELCVREPHAVPGAVDLRIEAGRFAEGCDRVFEAATLVIGIAKIEMRDCVARFVPQDLLEMGLSVGETSQGGQQIRDAVRRAVEIGLAAPALPDTRRSLHLGD